MKEKNIKEGIMVIIDEVRDLHVQTLGRQLQGLKKSEDVLSYMLSLDACVKKLNRLRTKLEDLAELYADAEAKNDATKGN